ncbi:MAG: BspA family leucine-rich repeat surface protein, partial [Bacteroidales bacterium]|nr:BspA family leucine-rich repeat surface protein [Bacteroidales bacterium]
MKKFFTILTMLIVLVSGISQQAQGQCTNTSQYGSATAPTSGTVTFSTCSYRSEYSPLSNVVSGTIYQCAISGGGFVTIRRGTYNGPVVAYGNSPLQWTATTGGTHYCHWNTNSSCGLEYNNCVTTTCTYMGFLPGENCTNPQNLATLTSPYSSTTVGYANDIGVCRTGYPDRIFYINVPNGYTVDIWQSANEYDSYHYMGYGGSCPGSTTLYCIDDPDTQHNPWTNTTGSTQTVYFVVDAYIGSGTFTLQWTLIDRTVTSATSGNWSASSTWVGGMVPTLNDNVVVSAGHAVIADVVVERNNGRTTTVNTGGSLTTANGMAFYNYGSVTVSPGASLAIGDNYINGTTTINGICQINPGGYFTGSPTYGPSSTLVYNTGSTYNRGDEWTSTGGAGYPNNVTINSGSSLNLGYGGTGTARQMAGNLTLDGGLYMDYDSYDMTEKLNVLGNVVINTTGVLSLSNANLGDLHVKGNWTRNGSGTFNPNDRAVYFNGTGVQTITGATTFDYLRLFKTTGNVVLASDITVTRPLEINLSGGLVNTGSNKVIIASTGSVVRTNGWINGNLQKNIPTGTATHTFEIGDATVYAPVNLAFNNVTTAGDILASTVKPGSAPPVVSNISQINYLNRKWTITNAGTVFDNYNATFNFVAGDLTGGANTANFIVGKNDGGTWTNPTMGTKTATTTQITGVTSFSEFWMGESTYFITTWKTDNPGSDPDKVDFPGVGDNYSIYWEDASNPAINGTLTGNGITTITFPAAGTYKVNVTPGAGTFNRFNMNDGTDKQKLLDVNQWGTIEWTSMETAFYGCSNLNITATDLPVLSSVSSMSSMFSGCSVLNGPANITNWNTSAVTTMNSMFSGASAFNQNIGSWTFNSTVNLTNMLDNCGMDCSIYSATLTGWYANPSTPNGLSLGADGRQYNCSAYAARTILTGVKGWSINGDSPCEAGPTATLENTGDAPCLGFALLDVIGDPDIVSIDYYNGSTLVHSAVRLPATEGSTVAGGNGGGSNASQLYYPTGVFVDGSGNIFIADHYNHRIQKWVPGAISGTTVAGGNGAGSNANQLDYTTGVFVDGSGYIFIADHYNHRIQKWAPGATSGTTVAGGNGPGSNANQLNYPFGVHVDGAGNIFIADRDNHRIQKWEPGATSGATVAGGNEAGSNANQLNYPYGFHVDGAGNIFIADQSNHRIQKWAPGATSGTTVAGGNGGGSNANQLRYPQGVHVDRTGNIFIADVNNHRIQKWDGTMVTNYTPVVGGTYIAVVTTSSGCSVATNEIVVYDLPLVDAGTYEPVSSNAQPVILGGEPIGGEWTGTGVSGNPSDGYIFDPSAGTQELTYTITDGNGCSNSDQAIICIIPVLENTGDTPCLGFALLDVIGDPDIVSIDFYNGSTLVHSAAHLPATEGSTVAGGNGAGSNANQLYYPYGVHVDGAGNIFIADYYNHRIQKWAPGATSGTTVAGGNGEGSNANQLAYPTGVFVDGSGNIFIADYANHRIQKGAPGAISGTTVAGGNGYGSNANQLAYPYDVFVDGSGNIFIADRNNHR